MIAKVTAYRLTCGVCRHTWHVWSRESIPPRCANQRCKSRKWNRDPSPQYYPGSIASKCVGKPEPPIVQPGIGSSLSDVSSANTLTKRDTRLEDICERDALIVRMVVEASLVSKRPDTSPITQTPPPLHDPTACRVYRCGLCRMDGLSS